MVEQKLKELLPSQLPVYIGELPSNETDAVAVMLYDGNFNTEYFKSGTMFKPVVKIVVRHGSYQTGREWATVIKEALHRHVDDFFLSILMVGYPRYLGRDPQKLHEFQLVFNLKVKE